jgi:hypothetical protein
MNELPTELRLDILSGVARVEDPVNLSQVSKSWRELVNTSFGSWLRNRAGEQLELFTARELGWVLLHLDGCFCSVVECGASFELTGCCGSVGTGAGVGYLRSFSTQWKAVVVDQGERAAPSRVRRLELLAVQWV